MLGAGTPGVFAAAAAAASVAAELEDARGEICTGIGTALDSADTKAKCSAEARLSAALEVNRALHASLADRKRLLRESLEELALLGARLAGRSVEEPLRKARIEELLDGRAQGEAVKLRAARDATMLGHESAKLESKILTLNEENLYLADQHRAERTACGEKQSKLRILGKRERELAKQLDTIASKFSDASNSSRAEGSMQPDFRNLPGLYVNKLVGRIVQREPPSVGPMPMVRRQAPEQQIQGILDEQAGSERAPSAATNHLQIAP